MGAKLIAYVCAAQGHVASAEHPDKLTIHEGRWAFCQFSARADDHVWRETGGEDVIVLLRKAGLHVAAAGNDIEPVGVRAATK